MQRKQRERFALQRLSPNHDRRRHRQWRGRNHGCWHRERQMRSDAEQAVVKTAERADGRERMRVHRLRVGRAQQEQAKQASPRPCAQMWARRHGQL